MKGGNWRLLRSVVALSLPTVLVAALGVFFFVDKVPEIVKAEKNRVKAEYRETALELRQNPGDERFAREASLPPVWRGSFAGKMIPGRWGFVPISLKGFTWVWYDDGNGVVFTQAPYVRERDYRTMFLLFGLLFILVLVRTTVVGIRYFVEYIRTRDDFLSAAAHDLMTPLIGMRCSIGRNDEEAKMLNERMIRLVANIKDFLRLGGRRPTPRRDEVDVLKCCREAYAIFREDYRDLFDGKDVPIEVDGDAKALADETLTVQILWNLFGNDLKYAAPYGKVAVELSAGGGMVRAAFVDEGQGMTRSQMKRAFDRYYRAKTVLEAGKGGFGIGLCTAREFARAMGGDLVVKGNAPKGCVFTLSLPAWPRRAGAAGPEPGSPAIAGKEA